MPETSPNDIQRVFLTADAVGGVWQYALDLTRSYQRRGIAVRLAVLGPPPGPGRRAELARLGSVDHVITGLPLDWLADDGAMIAEAGRKLAELARDWKPDIIHLNSPALAVPGDWPAPVVATLHSCVATWWSAVHPGNPMPVDFAWRTAATRDGLAAADAVIAPTRAFAAAAQSFYPDIAFDVVHNGRDALARPSPERERLGVITAGRLWDEAKNARVVDLASAPLPMRIAAAGPVNGPNGVAVLLPHLRLLGEIQNEALRQRFEQSAVFISAALYEPFGLGVLEAAQAGCALLLSDIPTLRELWGEAARFVDPRDPRAVAEGVLDIVADQGRRRRLGAAAHGRAARYTAAAMAAGTLAVYRAAREGGGLNRGAA